ncbi:unnamed protein product [Didymodactylos carnosus]|uniref:Uncharacterized protein n=1 Tax=Didymodactylos carnosus TaxID=1234261 RepID=A0A8S2DYP9_9BILA|nr:unnamed protein product [Didymodactylos carnosus]CAF3770991.1 unnamed protein product [Didymodactylos carnosus]
MTLILLAHRPIASNRCREQDKVLRYTEDVSRLERQITELLDKKEQNGGVFNQSDEQDYNKKCQQYFQLSVQLKTMRKELDN